MAARDPGNLPNSRHEPRYRYHPKDTLRSILRGRSFLRLARSSDYVLFRKEAPVAYAIVTHGDQRICELGLQ